MKGIALVVLTVCAWAQSGIEPPSMGAIVDRSGALRSVQGVAGNFLLGPAGISGVLSAACSEGLCLAKTDWKIVSAFGETDAPPGPAVFGIDGDTATVYFPQSREFARWHQGSLFPLDWILEGEVLSIREFEIAVRRDDRVWILRPDGTPLDAIADASGPVLLLANGVLFATKEHVVFRNRDGNEMRFELTGVESVAAMGPHYAAIRTAEVTYALRTDAGNVNLYLLPGSAP